MCGCEFNVAGAGGTIAGAVHGHFSSRSDISAIYHSALYCCILHEHSNYNHDLCTPVEDKGGSQLTDGYGFSSPQI